MAAALLPALAAAWLYWPTTSGSPLADELLLAGYVLAPDAASGALRLDWGRVGADFTGPWAFGFGSYYRPLVTTVLVLAHGCTGGAEHGLHVAGVGIFVAAAAAIAMFCSTWFGWRAGLAGGLLFACHPACHEPVCWPCTCADHLLLFVVGLTSAVFVRVLRGERRLLPWVHAGVCAALLTKENAVLLPVWLLLLDVAVRGRGVAFRERFWLHALFSPWWLGYFGWRWLVLGSVAADSGPLPTRDIGMWLSRQADKLLACVAPHGERLSASLAFTLGGLLAWAVVGALWWGVQRRWLVLGAVWMCVALLPVQWEWVSPDLGKSRYVVAALLAPIVLVAAVQACRTLPRWFRATGLVLLAAALCDLSIASRALQSAYATTWQHMQALRRDVDELGARADVASPVVLLVGLSLRDRIPFLPPTMAFALAEPPLARREHPFVSLGRALEAGVGHTLLEGECGPWRAMWQQGAALCYWPLTGGDRLVQVPRPGAESPIVLERSNSGFAVRGGHATPWPIGAIDVLADAQFEGGQVAWRAANDQEGVARVVVGARLAGGWSGLADMHDDAAFVVAGTLFGIESFRVDLVSAAGASAQELRVVTPVSPAPLPRRLRDVVVDVETLGAALPWEALPADADADTAGAVLMDKAFGFRVRRDRDGRVQVPAAARVHLAELDRFVRSDRVYYYLECRVHGRSWRSEVDWFRRVPARSRP